MLTFVFLGIPVQIQPWFWLTAAFVSGAFALGSGASGLPPGEEIVYILSKMILVLVSILIHELGHCYVLKKLGARPLILLHSFGGFAFWRGMVPTRAQQVAISLGGPAAGFLFAALLIAIVQLTGSQTHLIDGFLRFGIAINIFWNVLNLLPIRPLDGGHILEAALGRGGESTCRLVGAILGGGVALLFLAWGQIFAAVFFAILAYMNWSGDSFNQWTGRS